MKRFFTAILLLVLIIVVSAASLLYTQKQKNEYSDLLYSAYQHANDGDFKNAQQKVAKFCRDWEKNEPLLKTLIHHKDLDEISFTAAMIREYINCEDLPEFCAELRKELALLDHIWETEIPIFANIL